MVDYVHKLQSFMMRFLSSGEARNSFADTLNHVAYSSEHVAIQQAEDNHDLQKAENRMADSKQERVSFDKFFADLEAQGELLQD